MKAFMKFITAVGVLLSIALEAMAQGNVGPARTGLFPDSRSYALHGPRWVGTQDFVIGRNAERPLHVTVWYPAYNLNLVPEKIDYSYSSLLLRPVTIPGHALADAYPGYTSGPYPLVIVSHGADQNRFALNYLSEHLASHGFVVMAADHTGNATGDTQFGFPSYTDGIAASMVHRPRDIRRQIEFAAELIGKGGALPGLIDLQHIAVLGHSSGAYTALASAGARVNLASARQWCASVENEPAITSGFGYIFVCRSVVAGEEKELAMLGAKVKPGETWPAFDVSGVDAVVLLGAWLPFGPQSFEKLTTPVLAIVGTADPNYGTNKWLFESLPNPGNALLTLDNASHDVLVQCDDLQLRTSFPCGFSEQVWNPARVQDRVRHVATAFLLHTLKGDKDALEALKPGAVNFPGTKYESTIGSSGKSAQTLERTRDWEVGDRMTYVYVRNGRSMLFVEEVVKVDDTGTHTLQRTDDRTYEALRGTRTMSWSRGICFSNGQMCEFSPALLSVDFPLESGKTWSGRTTVKGDAFVSDRTYQARAEGVEKMTVPAGEFDAYKVSFTTQFEGRDKKDGVPWSGTESYADWWVVIRGKAVVLKTEYRNSFGEVFTRELVSAEIK